MTTTEPTDLLDQARERIAERRALLAAGYRTDKFVAVERVRAALVAVASTDEEPCRCIASGVGGTHYPSDHRPAASGTDTREGEAS